MGPLWCPEGPGSLRFFTLLDERRDRFTEIRKIVSDRFEDSMLEGITNNFDYIRNTSCRDPDSGLKEIPSTMRRMCVDNLSRKDKVQGGGTWSGYVSLAHLPRQQ